MGVNGYLLDTHAFVWAATEPDKLSPEGRSVLTNPESSLFVSAASAWEIATKVRSGRWDAAVPVDQGFDAALRGLGAQSLPITIEDGLRGGRLEWSHRDPFDRMLVAQALAAGLTIITADSAISGYVVATLW